MSPFFAVFLVLLLASSSYAAGRLHGQLSYRIGYRFGYRQGYFDGDRGAWNRRRRETRAAIASVLPDPVRESEPVRGPGDVPVPGPEPVQVAPVVSVARATGTDLAVRHGTTYTGAAFVGSATAGGGRHAREIVVGQRP
ncbi:hypothetical protein ACN27F_12605 [Solwaraspora sp. WMMB335]|uniref:hypothetical protein n=1 Tax=Solwaraspora sp. WMMB335 TaxID=3404118 RepID=UPI003B95A85D